MFYALSFVLLLCSRTAATWQRKRRSLYVRYCTVFRLPNKNGGVTVTQIFLLTNSQIGHHQVILQEYANDDGM
jgi:hypothetical protein